MGFRITNQAKQHVLECGRKLENPEETTAETSCCEVTVHTGEQEQQLQKEPAKPQEKEAAEDRRC